MAPPRPAPRAPRQRPHPLRLDANNADSERVFILDAITGPGLTQRSTDLHRDAAHLRDSIVAHSINLIVIDSLGSFLRSSDRASEGALRDALQPLMAVIAKTGVAVLGVMCVGKTGQNRRPAQRLVGSFAVPAIARSVIMIARAFEDETDDTPGRSILEVVKSSSEPGSTKPPETLTIPTSPDPNGRRPPISFANISGRKASTPSPC